MLQDDDVWGAVSRDTSHLRPYSYSDPCLLSRPKYIQFLQLLFDRGILSFTQTCRGRVGAFSVSIKPKIVDGCLVNRQRLVLDCRQTNQLFRPPRTELGSLACLTELEIPDSSCLFVSGADIQDCFYAVHIPADLMSFFCLEGDIFRAETLLRFRVGSLIVLMDLIGHHVSMCCLWVFLGHSIWFNVYINWLLCVV